MMDYSEMKWAIVNEDDEVVKEVSLEEWCKWIAKSRHKRILERNEIETYTVSTIFLGLDHQWAPGGRPLYWETMILTSSNVKPLDYMERYSTAKQARAGHARAIKWLKKRLSEKNKVREE